MNLFMRFLQTDHVCIIDLNWVHFFFKQKEMGLALVWIWPISTRCNRWQRSRVSVFACKVNDAVRPLEQCPEWGSQIFINIEVKMELITHWSIGLWKPHCNKTQSMPSISRVFYLLNFSHEVLNLSYCFPLASARARLLGTHL